MDHYPRFLKLVLERDLHAYPAVAVMGARQVGKSTLCKEIARQRGMAYRTLDDRDVRDQALNDPEGLLDDLGEAGGVLDEVQRAPDLLLAVKAVVDRDQRPGRYLLTGSNQPRVGNAIGESLQGRTAYRTLRPLTLSEQRFDDQHPGWQFLFATDDASVLATLMERAESSGKLNWLDAVRTGGFPRVMPLSPADRLLMLDDYVQTFARRDIRDVLGIESVERFESFLRLAASRTGHQLNVSGLSSELGTPVNTIRRWVDALKRSYLAELIPPYSGSASHRVIKAPKIFIVDVALALAAAREPDPTGLHLETLVAADLCAWRDSIPGRGLYHWRLAGGQEVDFVLEEGGRLLPVEIKTATHTDSSDTRHIRRFQNEYPRSTRGLVLSCDPEIRILSDGTIAAPWWAVL